MEAPTTDTSASSQQENAPANEVPSGFILKLFQMVNGAPDEVIAVSDILFFENGGIRRTVPTFVVSCHALCCHSWY